MAFIINRYDKYNSWDRQHSKKVFELNEQWYAIYEVELEWGLPQLGTKVDRDIEKEAQQIHVYDTYEDALQFVLWMKGVNAR